MGKLKLSKNNLEGLQTSVTITVIFSFVKEITLFFRFLEHWELTHTKVGQKVFSFSNQGIGQSQV